MTFFTLYLNSIMEDIYKLVHSFVWKYFCLYFEKKKNEIGPMKLENKNNPCKEMKDKTSEHLLFGNVTSGKKCTVCFGYSKVKILIIMNNTNSFALLWIKVAVWGYLSESLINVKSSVLM